nr:hypothetical protein [Marseillevirus cajuinensis]
MTAESEVYLQSLLSGRDILPFQKNLIVPLKLFFLCPILFRESSDPFATSDKGL